MYKVQYDKLLASPEQNTDQILRTLGEILCFKLKVYFLADWPLIIQGVFGGWGWWESSIRAETGEAMDGSQLLLPDTVHFRTPPFEI